MMVKRPDQVCQWCNKSSKSAHKSLFKLANPRKLYEDVQLLALYVDVMMTMTLTICGKKGKITTPMVQ
jgi:hypothetical protein